MKCKLHVECEFDKEILVDILSGATYGSYWLEIQADEDIYQTYREDGDCIEDVWAKILLSGNSLKAIDQGDDEEAEYAINLSKFKKGINAMANENIEALARILDNDGDADFYDYDSLIQCVIFGETIYG